MFFQVCVGNMFKSPKSDNNSLKVSKNFVNIIREVETFFAENVDAEHVVITFSLVVCTENIRNCVIFCSYFKTCNITLINPVNNCPIVIFEFTFHFNSFAWQKHTRDEKQTENSKNKKIKQTFD